MNRQLLCALLPAALSAALTSCSPAPPSGPVAFTSPRLEPGTVIRSTVSSSFKGGKFEASSPEASASGSLSIERNRLVRKSILEADENGPTKCTIEIPEDEVSIRLLSEDGDQRDTLTGPLVGMLIEATREGDSWSLSLPDQVPDADEADALLGIQSFENRRYFPDRPVALGESWTYDPVYFRTLLERDLGAVDAEGTMTFRSIETHPDGSTQARLDLVISSAGQENTAGGDLDRRASIEARGSLIINLETMLDREMIIDGTLRSGVSDDSSSASIELPIRMEIRREILSGD